MASTAHLAVNTSNQALLEKMRQALRRASSLQRRGLAGRAWDGRQSTDPWRRAPAGATRATAPAAAPAAARPPKTAAARAAAAATSQLNAWRSAVDWQSVQAQSAREVLNLSLIHI